MVIGLEGCQDIVRLIVEIEYKSARLCFAGIRSVQTRQRLDALHAAKRFIHIHGAELWLVKAGLKLIGNQHHLIVITIKRVAHIAPFQRRVHIHFSEFVMQQREVVHVIFLELNLARKCHHGGDFPVALISDVFIKSQFIPHRCFARAGYHHRFCLAAKQMHHVLAVMLNDDFYLLRDVMIVQRYPLAELHFCPMAVHLKVFFTNFLQQLISDFVVGVVFQHIENKPFLDGLTHGVNVECRRFVGSGSGFKWSGFAAKQLQRFCLWRSGEGVEIEVAATAAGGKSGVKNILRGEDHIVVGPFAHQYFF
ncbi:hypothetical protein D3C75_668390 [compost metagenome]